MLPEAGFAPVTRVTRRFPLTLSPEQHLDALSLVRHLHVQEHPSAMPVRKKLPRRLPTRAAGGMYLSALTFQQFRSCRDVRVKLQPGLTLLVGENNSGKSNVIDGVRLVTKPLSGRPTRYFEVDDVSFDESGPIELTAEFAGLTKTQESHYITALDDALSLSGARTRLYEDSARDFDERPLRRAERDLVSVVQRNAALIAS